MDGLHHTLQPTTAGGGETGVALVSQERLMPARQEPSAIRSTTPKKCGVKQPPGQALPRSPWTCSSSRKRPLKCFPKSSPNKKNDVVVIDLTENDDQEKHRHHHEDKKTLSFQTPAKKNAPTHTAFSMQGPPSALKIASSDPAELAMSTPPTTEPQPMPAFLSPMQGPMLPSRSDEHFAVKVTVAVAAADTPKSSAPPTPAAICSDDAEEGGRPRSIYLQHFEDTVHTAMRTRTDYSRLFTSEEREAALRFTRLSHAGKSLYVRLFQRKGPWFRVDGMLGYDEIGSGTPLWVRRRDAAAATTPLVGEDCSAVAVDSDKRDRSAMLPSNPFAPTMERASPLNNRVGCSTVSAEIGGGRGGGGGVDASSMTSIVNQSIRTPTSPPCIVLRVASEETGKHKEGDPHTGQGLARSPKPPTAEAAGGAAVCVVLSPQELTVLHGEIQVALLELVEAGFLDALPHNVFHSGPGLEAALSAIECCLKSPEIEVLLKRTGGKKTPTRSQTGKLERRGFLTGRSSKGKGVQGSMTSAAEAGGRQGIIGELRRRLTGQQTLWGAKLPIIQEVEHLVSVSVEGLGVDMDAGKTCGNGGGRRSSRDRSSTPRQEKQRLHWLVRVADSPRLVFKRALRLMYLTCSTGDLSSGRVGEASVRGTGASGTISSWSPGLSVAFGKTRQALFVFSYFLILGLHSVFLFFV